MSRLILIGCVATKKSGSKQHPARDLYDSPLFRKRRAYAERAGHPWYVLSAAHGLVHPDRWLLPYNLSLTRYRIAPLVEPLRGQLLEAHPDVADLVLEVHAGAHYVDLVERVRLGTVEAPLAGLGIGRQLAWYNRQAEPSLF